MLDEQVRMKDENYSLGIILCKSKNKTIVEYALKESTKPIGIATYRMVSTLPQELKGQLPTQEQVAKLLSGMEWMRKLNCEEQLKAIGWAALIKLHKSAALL